MIDSVDGSSKSVVAVASRSGVESLAQQWAKKYLQNLHLQAEAEDKFHSQQLSGVISQRGRLRTAAKLMESLRTISAQAWHKTEALLAKEVKRHRIDPKAINPWEIAADSFRVYQKVLDVYTQQGESRRLSMVMRLTQPGEPLYQPAMEIYTEQIAPSQLVTVIGADVAAIRKKYTSIDPRVIGFVSMQFHYTGQMLLQPLSPLERSLVSAYFKVIDDHLYMPLHRAYAAAAEHNIDSVALTAVQQLLPGSTEIAKRVCQRVIELYPTYRSYSGYLSEPDVKVSTIRDVEMFQVYLWVCALECNISAIQQELFPLCVMLYPTLKVQWELVRQMLHLMGQEMRDRLNHKQAKTLMSYFQVLWEMFSPQVFGELNLEHHTSATYDQRHGTSLFG